MSFKVRQIIETNRETILTAYRAGTTINMIALSLGVSPPVIRGFLGDEGVPIRGRSEYLRGKEYLELRRFTREQEKQIVAEYLEGAGSSTLADRWNTTSSTVRNILRRNQIEMRRSWTGNVADMARKALTHEGYRTPRGAEIDPDRRPYEK